MIILCWIQSHIYSNDFFFYIRLINDLISLYIFYFVLNISSFVQQQQLPLDCYLIIFIRKLSKYKTQTIQPFHRAYLIQGFHPKSPPPPDKLFPQNLLQYTREAKTATHTLCSCCDVPSYAAARTC